jgi:hypothetical protein
LNISTAIAVFGRERRRNLSEETDNDYTDTVAGRPSRAAARAPSVSDLRCRRIGLAVLAAVAIAIALAIPNVPDIGTIYVTVT